MALSASNYESSREAPNKFFPSSNTAATNLGLWGPLAITESAKTVDGLLTEQEGGLKNQANNKFIWKWNQAVGQERHNKIPDTASEAKQHEAWLVKSPMGQQTIHKALLSSPLTTDLQIMPLTGYLGISPIVLRDYLDTCYPRRGAMILTYTNEPEQ